MSVVLLYCNNRFFVVLTDYWFSYHNRSINRLTGESAQLISTSSEGPSTTRTSTVVPTTTSTNSSPNVTVTTGSNVNTDGMFAFMPVLFITYGLLFAYQYTDNLY